MSGFSENDIAAKETEKAMSELRENLKPYMPEMETGVYNRIFSAIYKEKQIIESLKSKNKGFDLTATEELVKSWGTPKE